jgi:hypothetical protein
MLLESYTHHAFIRKAIRTSLKVRHALSQQRSDLYQSLSHAFTQNHLFSNTLLQVGQQDHSQLPYSYLSINAFLT